VGGQVGENVLISDGLKPGERIVLEGIQKVRDGATVQPMTAEQMAAASQTSKEQMETEHGKKE
jgi:membrane fusion protein (multidrug efflux system)